MFEDDMKEKAFHSLVCESHAKLSLITDYLERFKIEDVRIVAPIRDIERCVDMMGHALGMCDQDHHDDFRENIGGDMR